LLFQCFFLEENSFLKYLKIEKLQDEQKSISSLGRKSLYSGKKIPMERCQQTGQFPPNVIMGDDVSNIWYAIFISSSLHYCKVR